MVLFLDQFVFLIKNIRLFPIPCSLIPFIVYDYFILFPSSDNKLLFEDLLAKSNLVIETGLAPAVVGALSSKFIASAVFAIAVNFAVASLSNEVTLV